MVASPRALVIEDNSAHALTARVLLESVGFAPIEIAATLHAGAERLYRLLDVTQPFVPTLVLLDVMLPAPQCPELEGIVLAAQAIEAMEAGRLHLTHIVVFSCDLTDQRRHEVQLAGCSEFFEKPLSLARAQQLRTLVDTAPVLPEPLAVEAPDLIRSRQSLRRTATQLLRLLSLIPRTPSSIQVHWTKDRVKHLLFTPATLLRDRPWYDWITYHGGLETVHEHLIKIPLDQREHDLLLRILGDPQSWRQHTRQYAFEHNVSLATSYRHLGTLLEHLAHSLNDW